MATRDLNSEFEIVVSSRKVIDKHRCFDRGWKGAGQTPEGRVVCCKECGKHWFVYKKWTDDSRIWKPVRWYHYRIRRAIVGK
jgi:hypothetical protein